jgi:hypothetical protein
VSAKAVGLGGEYFATAKRYEDERHPRRTIFLEGIAAE